MLCFILIKYFTPYCYNIFLFPSAKQASLNERKIKVFCFSGMKVKVVCRAIAFIDFVNSFSSINYGCPLGGGPLHCGSFRHAGLAFIQTNKLFSLHQFPFFLNSPPFTLFCFVELESMEFVWLRSLLFAEHCGCSRH